MYAKVWNYLRGSVLFQCESPAPERVLNLCGVYGIPFWDVQWETAERFTLRTTRQGAAALEDAAAECGAELRRMEEWGAPTALRRMRRRYVLWGTLAAVLALFWYGNTFIWDFQVTGNETVPTEKILRALENSGVTTGTRSLSFDQEELRNHVLLELGDISWLSVNVKGCTAHVQVVERVRPPHLYRDCDVQNIVAARDGLITKIEALDGVTCAAVGETVQAGQVLLSGVADSPRGCRYMRATGRIWARTWYEWTVPVPLETVLKDGTEPVKTRTHTALDLGRHRIALPAGDSILQGRENCDKIIRYRGVQLPFGLRLPVTLVTETVAERAVYDGERPEDEARAEGQKQLEAQLAQTIGDDGRVLKADVSARRQGAYLMVTLRAECEEQIGVDAPLTITSDTGR